MHWDEFVRLISLCSSRLLLAIPVNVQGKHAKNVSFLGVKTLLRSFQHLKVVNKLYSSV